MKPLLRSPLILLTTAAVLFATPILAGDNLRHGAVVQAASEPVISAINGRKVRVKVPEGFHEVTLQRKTANRKSPWVTVSTNAVNGDAKVVTFTLRAKVSKRSLRVFGKKNGELPSAYFGGITNFLGEPVAAQPVGGLNPGGISTGVVDVTSSGALDASGTLTISAGAGSSARTVTESDIWKLDGDHLYFFNQYRGLQNIDVSDTAKPVLRGTLRMPGVGEDLYQLDAKHVVVIKRTPKELGWTSGSPSFDQVNQSGEILVCDVSTAEPSVVARIPFDGWVNNSRLIGTSLIIAKTVPHNSSQWGWNADVEVTGYDLANPAAPVERNTVVFSGNGHTWASAVQASNRCFMVAAPNYDYSDGTYKTSVHLVDVTSPDGTVAKGGTAVVQGGVWDKFKLQEKDGVVSVVSAVGWGRNGSYSHLENFDASDLGHPVSLGEITVGQDESTRAVRFDGDRVYIVTVVQQDPLWIVDNSDPANPTLSGELHVPGFSSYIEPLGDRLVTVGRLWGDDGSGNWQNRVTVSLYDVADATKPVQLSQLPVGTNWSHSEAEFDDKAFTVLPESGLIMLPYSDGWWRFGKYNGGVQLVDLRRDSLALRGVIQQGFTPRRTAIKDDTVLAISAVELLTVDIADRDKPVVKADVELAWNVNRAWTVGKHLLQLGERLGDRKSVLSVSLLGNADDTLSTLDLSGGSVLAAELKGDLLYVVQAAERPVVSDTGSILAVIVQPSLSVFSVASLPQIVPLGGASFSDASGGETSLLFPTDGTAVIAQRNRSYGWFDIGILRPIFGGVVLPAGNLVLASSAVSVGTATTETASLSTSSLMVSDRFAPGGWWGSGSSSISLLAFDVTNPRAPKFLNTTFVERTGNANFGSAVASNGKVFASHFNQRHYYRNWIDLNEPSDTTDDNRYFLNVVDYADPAAPVVAAPVSFPGELRAIDKNGLLYATGPGYDAAGNPDTTKNYVHATAFDGAAHLVDSIQLGGKTGDIWSDGDFRLGTGSVFVSRTDYTNSEFEAWTLGTDGKFVLRDTLALPYLYDWSISGDLALYRGGRIELGVVNIANPSQLENVGQFGGSTSWWYGVAQAVGDLTNGFWIPQGDYGVRHIPAPK